MFEQMGHSVTRDADLTSQKHATETKTMKQLLDEVKDLHEQRLRWLEMDSTATREELLQKKEDFLQSYVNDLTDQNQMLLQTVEELQMETDQLSKLDLSQQKTTSELRHQRRHLLSDVNSNTKLNQMGPKRNLDMKQRHVDVMQLNQDVISLRATQETLQRSLVIKEKRAQQLVQANAQLKEMLTSLQSKLQTSESTVQSVAETLDQTESSLQTERQQRQQIQEQLNHSNKEVERLQQELTRVHRTMEKKMQRREMKISSLMKKLAEIKMQFSDFQAEVFQKENILEQLSKERDDLRTKLEEQKFQCVHVNQSKERLEADLAQSHDKLHISHLEVRSRDQLILQLRNEMKTAELKYRRTEEQVAALESEVKQLNHKVGEHQKEAHQFGRKVRDAEQLKEQKEKERQQLLDRLCTSQQQVEACEKKLKEQEDEMGLLHQQLKGAATELRDARLQIQEQKETVAISKLKYAAAMEKVHKLQGQVELLEVELQYSQTQLRDSQLEAQSQKREQAELERRYQNKVGQWESSQEALDQLTDELQANQNLLEDSRQKMEHLQNLLASTQKQQDRLKQQKLELESDLQLQRQSHSHSDEAYFDLQRHNQQLQKCCAEQTEHIAECEKAIVHTKSELERRAQQNTALKQSLALSLQSHLNSHSLLEQEVTRLKNEITHLRKELGDAEKERASLLRKFDEELDEARRESVQSNKDAEVQKEEAQGLREELLGEKEKMRRATGENRHLSACIRKLSQELDELHGKHRVTVEDLAARAEEVRRMEGSLTEGKLAEEKIRSVAVKSEAEVAELRKNLQQAVSQKLKAEREKQDAQDQVDKLRSELEGTRSDNVNLHHESQLVMTNVDLWINEQRASSRSLKAQTEVQNNLLLLVTKEKEHLQEANDTLRVEVKRLTEVADKTARDLEGFKAQIRDGATEQDERSMKNQTCMARNLGKIEKMQTRLRCNLEAISMLNQQLNTLSGENKHLRRQLEEERSMRRRVEQRLPAALPNLLHSSSIRAPLCAAAPLSTSLPSSHQPNPLGSDPATGHIDGILQETKLSRAVLEKPAYRVRRWRWGNLRQSPLTKWRAS